MSSLVEIRVPLSPLHASAVLRWVATFRRYEENWAQFPSVEDGTLHTTAMALPFLLGYADPKDGALVAARVRREGERAIRRQLSVAPSVKFARYYFRALENLQDIAPGEFLAGVASY
jgi:hypothetical protein